MEMLLVLLAVVVLVMPVVSLVIAVRARQQVGELRREVERLRQGETKPLVVPKPVSAPPPRPVETCEAPKPNALPPPIPPSMPAKVKPVVAEPKGLTMEQFMGGKLFAWIGGLALFLGIVFFVKLSLERGWISPGLRVAIGLATGAALVIAGVLTQRKERYAVLAQTLCATGIVALYGVSFAAHALYQLPPFDHVMVTFGFMAVVTAVAFVLAVRMQAKVVAVLGLLGGFLTPVLCSTGRDQALALFGYIALLDLGVLAIVRRMRWQALAALAAAGTVLMQGGWMLRFFQSSGYAVGSATWVPVGLLLGFLALFTAALAWKRKEDEASPLGAILLAGGAMLSALVFLSYDSISSRPGVLYTLVFAIQALVMAVVWLRPQARAAQGIAASLGFLHLWIWTQEHLTTELLGWALGLYLMFGAMQTAFAVLWMRRGDDDARPIMCWAPLVSVVLMLLPVASLPEVSVMLWPALLVANLLVIGVAMASGSLMPVLAALVLTMITISAWVFGRLPANAAESLTPFLVVLGGFSVVFGLAASVLAKRHAQAPLAQGMPVSAAVMPFLLLIAAMMHLHVGDPTPVFGLGMALVVFLLALTRWTGLTVLVPTALGCSLALQWAWHSGNFAPVHARTALAWHAGFTAVFMIFPHLFGKGWQTRVSPWLASAASGLGIFAVVCWTVEVLWRELPDGFLPTLFSLPPLVGLAWVMRYHAADNPARRVQAGGFLFVALFFITLFFAWQFEKQWITLGWALEGAVLLGIGFRWHLRVMRQAGLAVVAMALTRLFFWDLERSDSLHRIGAFIGVAIVALGVSWLYQRFLSDDEPPACS